jgi:predicted 3-demethylubiquinone-9 3-methyltransferase (glyoxalase superfamily)
MVSSCRRSTAVRGFPFTEAISLFDPTATQDEIDHVWEKFTSGEASGRCGRLKDRYGLSWQIVPPVLNELLGDSDPNKSSRVMQAMLAMSKIVIASVRAAYEAE